MRLSVLIRSHNQAEDLERLLERLAEQEVSEVVLADPHSTDATPVIAQQFGVHVARVNTADEAAHWNAAVRIATGEMLWFLAPCCRVPYGAAGRIHDALLDGYQAGRFVLRPRGETVAASLKNYLQSFFVTPQCGLGVFLPMEALDRTGGIPSAACPVEAAYEALTPHLKATTLRPPILLEAR
jgi:glycosyltransferase involved in cell wall biosynthesis